jgi:hypothetical protein
LTQRGDEIVTKPTRIPTTKAMPDGLKGWLVVSLVVLVGSLILFAGDVSAGFAYFIAKTAPAWVTSLGVAAVIGMSVGIAGLVLVFFLTTLRSRRDEAARTTEPG